MTPTCPNCGVHLEDERTELARIIGVTSPSFGPSPGNLDRWHDDAYAAADAILAAGYHRASTDPPAPAAPTT